MKMEIVEQILPLVETMRKYHKHQVKGLQHFPQTGGVLLAVNHSLATYDISLLAVAIYESTGRVPNFLADRLFFKIPYVGEIVNQLGAIEGSPENAKSLLRSGELVVVAPGGMREALRPSTERYQIMWEKRKGFAKIALETQVPVVLGVCPKADDLYEVYKNRVTALAYHKFKIPLFFASGLGFSPIPKPIELTHFLSEPMVPPKVDPDPLIFSDQLNKFHKKLVKRAQTLIGEAIAYRK